MKKWWDKSCARKKKRMKKALQEWKRGKGPKTVYVEKRRNGGNIAGKRSKNSKRWKKRNFEVYNANKTYGSS